MLSENVNVTVALLGAETTLKTKALCSLINLRFMMSAYYYFNHLSVARHEFMVVKVQFMQLILNMIEL